MDKVRAIGQAVKTFGPRRTLLCLYWVGIEEIALRISDRLDNTATVLQRFAGRCYQKARAQDG